MIERRFVGFQLCRVDLELLIDAPAGETTIQCIKGCRLSWAERVVNAAAAPATAFTYRCTAPRCASEQVGGCLIQ